MRQGAAGVSMLVALVEDDEHDLIPSLARRALLAVVDQLREAHETVAAMERQFYAWHRSNELSRRLETIPGIGPITASAIAADGDGCNPVQIRSAAGSLDRPRARQNSPAERSDLGVSASKAIPTFVVFL